MNVAEDLVLGSHQVTPFGTDRNFVLLSEQACSSCSALSNTHFWWWFGYVVINRILHNFILTIVWNELKAQQGKILSFVSRMLLKTSLTMLKVISSLLKMTGKRSELSVMMTWPLRVMWFQTPTCNARNCVTWNLTTAEQGIKFQFWSDLKSFDVKFKHSNLAGCNLKPKLPNGA